MQKNLSYIHFYKYRHDTTYFTHINRTACLYTSTLYIKQIHVRTFSHVKEIQHTFTCTHPHKHTDTTCAVRPVYFYFVYFGSHPGDAQGVIPGSVIRDHF